MQTNFEIQDITLDTSNDYIVAALATLYHESYMAWQKQAGNEGGMIDEYDAPDIEGWRDRIPKSDDKTHIRAIFNTSGDPIAFADFGPKAGSHETAELQHLYVHPDHWNEGLGTKLFNDAVETLRQDGYKSLHLEIEGEEEGLIDFYKKRGCHEIPGDADADDYDLQIRLFEYNLE